MNSFHVKGKSQDKIDIVVFTPIRNPVSTMHAFNSDEYIAEIRFDKFHKRLTVSANFHMDEYVFLVINDAGIKNPGMQVNTALIWVRIGVEFHRVFSVNGELEKAQ